MTKLSEATRTKLKSVSTATVATALFKRGLRIQMIQDVHPLGPDQPTMVGEAFTLRYMPAREDLNTIDVFRDRSHPQRKAVEDCPAGSVLVMDSRKDARAASAGAILVTRLMKRGVAGVVTEEVNKGRGIFGLYPATDPQTLTDFAAWRKKNGR